MNKRGADLITVVIWLVVGVLVATFLIIGFTRGWSTFTSWFSPGNNVDTIVNQCQAACATGNNYGYCTAEKTLKAPDLPEGGKEKTGTCSFFATTQSYYDKYKVEKCPNLCQ